MLSLFSKNDETMEMVIKFNQHPYNYLYSTLRNDLYPKKRGQKICKSWDIKVTNCMKLFTLILYMNESRKPTRTSSKVPVCYKYNLMSRYFKVTEDTIKSWLKSLEHAAFVFVTYGLDNFSAVWNDENHWIKKAITFKDNGRYNYFKYSTYPVCSIVIPEEMDDTNLALKYIDQIRDVICDEFGFGILSFETQKNMAIKKTYEALQSFIPSFYDNMYMHDTEDLKYILNLVNSIKKIIKFNNQTR